MVKSIDELKFELLITDKILEVGIMCRDNEELTDSDIHGIAWAKSQEIIKLCKERV